MKAIAAGLVCIALGAAGAGCATVTVIESEGEGAPSATQRSLREASARALSEARAAGWGEAPGGSFTDVLRNGRSQDGPEDAVAAYFAAKGAGLSREALRAAVAGDLSAASRNAAGLADLGDAVLAAPPNSGFDARDLQEAERALILFKRGETLFSAAVARLEDKASPLATATARARLDTFRADIQRLARTVDALAERHMDAAEAVS